MRSRHKVDVLHRKTINPKRSKLPRRNSLTPHGAILVFMIVTVILAFSIYPAEGATTFGRWRDINPTQYSTDVTGTLRGTYIRNGGSGSIGAGDGWAVGGDGTNGVISHYDGFSWQILPPPILGEYNSANFCISPGAPGVGSLCNVNGDGSDGWLVGGNGATVPIATYWDGSGLTEVVIGLTGVAGNLTSVFMVCHSPQFSLGCSGPFAVGRAHLRRGY